MANQVIVIGKPVYTRFEVACSTDLCTSPSAPSKVWELKYPSFFSYSKIAFKI
jgi:hypothetical protein